jgi:hypothetical protein
MAKSGTSTAVSLTELAPLLGISKTRVHQLVAEGVIPRGPGGRFDPLEAAVAVLGWFRRDEATKQARLRLLHASAANHERRLRRHVRQLLTVDELRDVLMLAFGRGVELVQAETSRLHGEMAGRLPDDEARRAAHAVYDHLRRVMLGFRNGATELCDVLEREALPAEVRVAVVFERIMADATAGAEPEPAKRKAKRRA